MKAHNNIFERVLRRRMLYSAVFLNRMTTQNDNTTNTTTRMSSTVDYKVDFQINYPPIYDFDISKVHLIEKSQFNKHLLHYKFKTQFKVIIEVRFQNVTHTRHLSCTTCDLKHPMDTGT